MEFNIVITNPPYNKGMDLDFIDMAYKISTDCVVAITPAKWQTADRNQNTVSEIGYGVFRDKYVKRMKYVCFYPDCLDIFGISQADGISIYFIDRTRTYENNCIVENKCNLQKYANSIKVRDIMHGQTLWNIGNDIVNYLGDYDTWELDDIQFRKEYTVNINTQLADSRMASGAWDFKEGKIKDEFIGRGGQMFNQNGQLLLVNKSRILRYDEKSEVTASKDVFTSNNLSECESFCSWINSKFTRFFILINISSLNIINSNSCRFVPAPILHKFDHIYSDIELYKSFKLPQEYIEVIESTMKERKQTGG